MKRKNKQRTTTPAQLWAVLATVILVALFGASAILNPKHADANTDTDSVYISEIGKDTNNGLSANAPFRTIRRAIQEAKIGRTIGINVLGSQYGVLHSDFGTLNDENLVATGKDIHIKGNFVGTKTRVYSVEPNNGCILPFTVQGNFSITQLKFDNMGLSILGYGNGTSWIAQNVFDYTDTWGDSTPPQTGFHAADQSSFLVINNTFNVLQPLTYGFATSAVVDGRVRVTNNIFNMPTYRDGDPFQTYVGISPARAYGNSTVEIARNTFKTIEKKKAGANQPTSSIGIVKTEGKWLTGTMIIKDNNFLNFRGVQLFIEQQ